MSGPNDEINAAMREKLQASRLTVIDASEEAAPEGAATDDPDFGGGAGNRKAMPVEESMSDMIRASFYGAWRRSGP